MKTTRLITLLLAGALAACGGGGGGGGGSDTPPPVAHKKPVLELVSPAAGSTLTGTVKLTFKATGDGITIKALAITAPSSLASANAKMDDATFTATIEGAMNTMSLPDGVLTVSVRTTDSEGQDTAGTYTFLVNSGTHSVTVDGDYVSLFDEANVQLAQSGGVAVVPAQYVYASTDKVAVVDGAMLNKIVSRLSWSGPAPSAADLNSNPFNLPVMRLLTAHSDSEPPISSAQALVTVGTGAQVTVDLIPDATSPAGQAAYLLPLAANLFPDLGSLTATTEVKVSAIVKDALTHVATGGPWTVRVQPLAPPVVAVADLQFTTSTSDARSVYAGYKGQKYSDLWNPSAFALDGGARVYHIVVSNPSGVPVSVGVPLGGAKTWSLSENWTPVATSSTVVARMDDPNPTNGSYCSWHYDVGNDAAVICWPHADNQVGYLADGSSTWSCVDHSYATGPHSTLSRSGTLSTRAYVWGTTSAATKTEAGRYVVPAALTSSPGQLDIYVVRPFPSARPAELPLTWNGTSFMFNAGYTTVACTGAGCGTNPNDRHWPPNCYGDGAWTFTRSAWATRLASATETFSGTVAVDVQAYNGAAEYGPAATVLAEKTVSATVTH